jgi:predicted Zn finger-like uncharacterized protein
MQFICETCRANLQIADEKVRGKRLIVRCKRCGVQIRIADPALVAQPRASARDEAGAVPPPPPEASANEPAVWFAVVGKAKAGPLTREELGSRIAAGDIHPGTYVWKHGMQSWAPARTVDGLAALFPAPPPLPDDGRAGSMAPARAAEPALPFDSSPEVPPLAESDAVDLARWGAEELGKPRVDTPLPAIPEERPASASIAKPEFRIGQPQRRGPLRAALFVAGAAAVVLLSAFAILYERRDSARPLPEVARADSSLSAPAADPAAKAPHEQTAAPAAADVSTHGTVPSPDLLKKKVDESMPALQGCVDEAVQREPALRVGKILILTTVAPSGEVTSTRIDKKNVDQSALGACLKAAARNIHFPSFTGEAFPLDIPVVVAGGN